MKSIVTLSVIALSTLLFTSCRKHALRGEGATISETRELSGFTTVDADGSTDIEIYPGTSNRAIVTGYQNLIPVYETDVRGNTLHLDFKRGYFNIMNNNIKVTLYVTDMNSINLNGSGKIYIHPDLAATTLDADVNGSGDIYIYDNSFETFRCKVNGSGSINAQEAVCDRVYADISGSGDIDVTVNDLLDAKISGSGSVDYWGSPETVNTDISGSGEVRKKN